MNAPGAALLVILLAFAGPEEDLAAALAKLKAVAPEGKGNEDAARAWGIIVAKGPDALIPTLAAMEGADARAANWLRSAVDAIVENAVAKKRPLDLNKVEAFVVDAKGSEIGRALAYEWLARLDPTASERILPGLLDDPGRELRRHAVGRALTQAEALLKGADKKTALEPLRKLLSSARDRDQVDAIVKHLKTLGVDTDLQALYGVIAKWVFITTFDNTGMKGYDVAYAPEKAVDLKAALPGKGDKAVRFVSHTTPEPRGKIDLNAVLGKEMGAVAYAYAVVDSPAERPVELRAATNNAVKIFLNGELLFFRNEYHHGMTMDQYVGRGKLHKGANQILIKVCQNEQKDDWAQTWGFQARLCDPLGGAVPFTNVTPEVKP
jgi:hypothetical protein